MSGAEAITAIQLIDACIGITKTIIDIGRAVHDAHGLPPKLRNLLEKLPAIEDLLDKARENCDEGRITEEKSKKAQPILKQCEQNLGDLREIFRKACPKDGENYGKRVWKGAKTVFFGRDSQVQKLLVAIQDNLKLLEQAEIYTIGDKLDELQELTEALIHDDNGKYTHSGSGHIVANEGDNTTNYFGGSGNSRQIINPKEYHEGSSSVQVSGDLRLQGHFSSVVIHSTERRLKDDMDKIPYVQGAIFNSVDSVHTLCHPNTRCDILSQVQAWAQQADGKPIFWLYGGAGAGKSTVSFTTAQWLTESGHRGGVDLGASFFFTRSEGDRGSARRFFPTIIRQLVMKIAGLGILIAKAVESDPFIFDRALPEQFRRLMLQPLQDLCVSGARQPTLIVVVDALDECEKEVDIRTILELWSQLAQLISLRLFLTSRPELAIRLEFQRMSIDRFRDIDLVDAVPLNTIQHDLFIYLNDSLCSIREDYNHRLSSTLPLNDSWPDRETIQQLVDIAVPLFIVAATICRFIGDLEFDPQDSLEEILSNRTVGEMSQMELTYLPILSHLTLRVRDDKQKERLHQEFRVVVGSIILLGEPLSMTSLATLLDVSVPLISRRLTQLHSVLRIPTDHDTPIRMLHLSFSEFLLSTANRKQPFGIDGPSTHFALSRHCLRLLSRPDGLRENVCGLKYPGQPRHEVESLTITTRLCPALQYACRYWVYHVQQSLHRNQEGDLIYQLQDRDAVHSFLKQHLLHWLEALSLLGRLSEVIGLVGTLQSCVSATASELSALLVDTRRFILVNRYIINVAPLQLYSCAIIFAPQDSVVRAKCGRVPDWVQQHPRTGMGWGAELQKLEGHSKPVCAVAFSPDGRLLASGSWDNSIRLWDTQDGSEVQKLEGHTDSVHTVAFAPDGNLLASGSDDETIRLWDTQTGGEIQKLKICPETVDVHFSPPGSVKAVAFSSDSCLLASAIADRTIRLWEIQTGSEVGRLKGHFDSITTLAFIPNSCLLASGSVDETIRLWDVQSGSEVQTLQGHSNPVYGIACSPDGRLLASGSRDGPIRLWDTQDGTEVQRLEDDSSPVFAVTFSPNGRILADSILRLWDTQSGVQIEKLEGHSKSVHAVAFSPDGRVLASGSWDNTIRLWDTQNASKGQKFKAHTDRVHTVVFSPDGLLLASGSWDNTIRLWDAQSGNEVQTLEGHTNSVLGVAFSPDNRILASGSSDFTIRLWDIQSGSEIRKLEGHSSTVYGVAFSPDGYLIASASSDKTTRLWNIQTGDVQELVGCNTTISAVAFSPDNHLLASGSFDGMILLWDTQSGSEVQKLEGHSGLIYEVTFSSEGRLLASGSRDGTIRLWDTQTGQEVQRFKQAAEYGLVRFVDNNKTILTDQGTFNIDAGGIHNTEGTGCGGSKWISISDYWIRRGDQNLLWLPYEYRGRAAIHGDKLAIGADSGLVSIFQFGLNY